MNKVYRRNGHATTGSRPEDLSREELRALIWPEPEPEGEKNRRAYDVRLLREFGAEAGLFLSRLVWLTGKGHDPDGWIFLTKEQIREDTGINRYKSDKIRDQLEEEGVLECALRTREFRDKETRKVRKLSSQTLHYRVKLAVLADRLGLKPEEDEQTLDPRFTQSTFDRSNGRPSTAQSADLRLLKQPNVDSFHIQGDANGTNKGDNRGRKAEPAVAEPAAPQPVNQDGGWRSSRRAPAPNEEALAQMKAFEEYPGDSSLARQVRAKAYLALEWDFAQEQSPETSTWLKLGINDDDRETLWKKMHKVACGDYGKVPGERTWADEFGTIG